MVNVREVTAKPSVIVTGGGTGIGFAIAQRFVRGGYGVSIVGRRKQVIDQAASHLSVRDNAVIPIARDIAGEGEADSILAEHLEVFGNLTALISSAGVYAQIPFLETTAKIWDDVLNVNLRGTMLLALSAARTLAETGGGRIVFIGSVLSRQSEPNTSAYSASKAAISSLTKSMAIDLAPYRIRVNCIAPGWVRTAMAAPELDAVPPSRMQQLNPLARAAAPDEIANLAWYLANDAPDFLNGETLFIDGGQSIRAPTL